MDEPRTAVRSFRNRSSATRDTRRGEEAFVGERLEIYDAPVKKDPGYVRRKAKRPSVCEGRRDLGQGFSGISDWSGHHGAPWLRQKPK